MPRRNGETNCSATLSPTPLYYDTDIMYSIDTTINTLQRGGPMVIALLGLALLALLISIDKAYLYLHHMRLPSSATAHIASHDFAWESLDRCLKPLSRRNYFARFLRIIADHRAEPSWWIESRAADEAQLIQKSLGRGLWILETIVTVAPLLGLLGTIEGMMTSFKLIGSAGLVDPAGITGGVAEALIATAIGLVVAVLSLFSFNFFSARQAGCLDEMERIGTRLMDHIRLDQQARGGYRDAA
jgi:biopolymer transport protein ExbB